MTDCAFNSIQFIPKTHQFFTADTNGNIKLWDADIFERVLTIQVNKKIYIYMFNTIVMYTLFYLI